MQDNRYRYIFFDLDSLLDTRMSMLFMDSPDVLEAFLGAQYPRRLTDVFSADHRDQWVAAWAARTTRVLRHAKLTKVIDVINEYLERCHSRLGVDPDAQIPGMLLNTFPYVLTKPALELIKQGIFMRTGTVTHLKIIHTDPATLTAKWLVDQGVEKMVLYDYRSWLNALASTEPIKGCPHIQCLVPAISFDRTTAEVLEADRVLKAIDPLLDVFKVTSNLSRLLVRLELLDAELFSWSQATP